jgi:aspartate aminotransferase
MVKMVYGIPVIVTPEDGSFYPRMEDILKAVTSSTRAIIVNSPNNPSGVVFSEEFIQQIVEFCEKKNIYLIADDIYHKLVFDGLQAPNPCAYTERGVEESRLIILNAVSKIYGMTGFRIGWAVAPKAVIAVMNNIQAATTSCNSGILMAAAEAALKGPQDGVGELVSLLETNRDAMLQALAGIPGVRVVKPQGTFYSLPDFSAFGKDSITLCKFLLEKAFVVTVPGREFGAENHLRLSYCGTRADVIEGVARIRWALDPSSPKEIRIGEKTAVRDW